jgi:hypothetical protein
MASIEDQLQLEWRKLVIDKLNSLETGQVELSRDIADIKMRFAENTKVEELIKEVEKIKLWRAKAIGALLVLNVVCVFVGWLVQNVLIAKH